MTGSCQLAVSYYRDFFAPRKSLTAKPFEVSLSKQAWLDLSRHRRFHYHTALLIVQRCIHSCLVNTMYLPFMIASAASLSSSLPTNSPPSPLPTFLTPRLNASPDFLVMGMTYSVLAFFGATLKDHFHMTPKLHTIRAGSNGIW